MKVLFSMQRVPLSKGTNMATPNTKRKVSKTYSDLYSTPDIALDALCKVVEFDKDKTYFECCNGIGKVSSYFRDNLGINMITNELYNHAESDYTENFLKPNSLASESWRFDYIVSNPPYKIAQEFIQEGFKYAKLQYHLLRLSFLEGKTRKEELFSQQHLKRIFLFSYRISCTKGVEEEPQANAVAYCWLEFDRDYIGNPELIWL